VRFICLEVTKSDVKTFPEIWDENFDNIFGCILGCGATVNAHSLYTTLRIPKEAILLKKKHWPSLPSQ
jgi:hypothetical protein